MRFSGFRSVVINVSLTSNTVQRALRTSVHDIVLVQVINGVQDLLDCLRGVLFRKFASVADTVEQFSSRGQLGDNVEFVLWVRVSKLVQPPSPLSSIYIFDALWTRTNRQT